MVIVAISHVHHARNFALRGLAWSLALFGLVRLTWFESHAVLPFTQWQGRVATLGFGAPALPVDVTLACSGADTMALCAGAILAYPARWTRRLAGAAGGVAMILALNTVRIGSLGRAADSPPWFDALHLYIWPTLLVLAVAAYVFVWMRSVDQPRARTLRANTSGEAAPAVPLFMARPFVIAAAVILTAFIAITPIYAESATVLAVAAFIARTAAGLLQVGGVQAVADGNMLMTPHGAFAVTQECVSTPLIPIYLAAVVTQRRPWRWRVPAILAVVPLFIALGIARLLVVAVPAALVGSPLVVVHAFYQLLLAGILIYCVAVWRHGARLAAWRRAIAGGMLGGVCAYLIGPLSAEAIAVAWPVAVPLADPQEAIAFLPAFQVGLYIALSVAAFTAIPLRAFVAGLVLLAMSQVAMFAAVQVLVQYLDLMPQVRDVRAWAIAGPALAVMVVERYVRPRQRS
jgi:exosortase/archaeosortase family protein